VIGFDEGLIVTLTIH